MGEIQTDTDGILSVAVAGAEVDVILSVTGGEDDHDVRDTN